MTMLEHSATKEPPVRFVARHDSNQCCPARRGNGARERAIRLALALREKTWYLITEGLKPMRGLLTNSNHLSNFSYRLESGGFVL